MVDRFHSELLISTEYMRRQDHFGNITWLVPLKPIKETSQLFELEIHQIFCDGDGSYTMHAECSIGNFSYKFTPMGTLKDIFNQCTKFREFYLLHHKELLEM